MCVLHLPAQREQRRRRHGAQSSPSCPFSLFRLLTVWCGCIGRKKAARDPRLLRTRRAGWQDSSSRPASCPECCSDPAYTLQRPCSDPAGAAGRRRRRRNRRFTGEPSRSCAAAYLTRRINAQNAVLQVTPCDARAVSSLPAWRCGRGAVSAPLSGHGEGGSSKPECCRRVAACWPASSGCRNAASRTHATLPRRLLIQAAAALALLIAAAFLYPARQQLWHAAGLRRQVSHAHRRCPERLGCSLAGGVYKELPCCRASLLLQLASPVASLAAWAASAGGSTSGSSGAAAAAADDLDAAIEARIPRYWAEVQRICPNMTHRPYREFDAAQRTSLAHSQVRMVRAWPGPAASLSCSGAAVQDTPVHQLPSATPLTLRAAGPAASLSWHGPLARAAPAHRHCCWGCEDARRGHAVGRACGPCHPAAAAGASL